MYSEIGNQKLRKMLRNQNTVLHTVKSPLISSLGSVKLCSTVIHYHSISIAEHFSCSLKVIVLGNQCCNTISTKLLYMILIKHFFTNNYNFYLQWIVILGELENFFMYIYHCDRNQKYLSQVRQNFCLKVSQEIFEYCLITFSCENFLHFVKTCKR